MKKYLIPMTLVCCLNACKEPAPEAPKPKPAGTVNAAAKRQPNNPRRTNGSMCLPPLVL